MVTRWSIHLSSDEYAGGLGGIGDEISPKQRRLLVEQYSAPNRQVTAPQLALLAEVNGGYSVVNSLYGRMGRTFCNHTGHKPDVREGGSNRGKERLWATWSSGWQGDNGWIWKMLPEVAEALEQLGWVTPGDSFVSPDEIPTTEIYTEGAIYHVSVNAYERNAAARRQCIAAHGTSCCICGFSFVSTYGPEAEGYIHVHHEKPLSEIKAEYVVDPVKDLKPVCPNCHAFIHLGGGCRSITEVIEALSAQTRCVG